MSKRKREDKGWNSLPWRPTEVAEGGLGDADDCFVFTIEELDGSDYIMEKDAVGGIQVKSRGKAKDGPSNKEPAGKKQKKKAQTGTSVEEHESVEAEPMDVEDVELMEVEVGEGADAEDQSEGAADGGDDAVSKDSKAAKRAQKRKERKERLKKAKQAAKQQQQQQQQKHDGPSKSEAGDVAAGEQEQALEAVVSLPGWAPESLGGVSLHPLLIKNLARQGFHAPTPIQRRAIPLAIASSDKGKDVMGAAETGSGKTLAYGLPILDFLLKQRDQQHRQLPSRAGAQQGENRKEQRPLQALVLCPTRELAMQVTAHLQEMLVGDSRPGREQLSVVSIVGGLSDQKQERLLTKRQPQVVVATLGRLWELISSNEPHLKDLARLHFLVLDEADRMVEDGHYPELEKLMTRIISQQKTYQQEYERHRQKAKKAQVVSKKKDEEEDEEDDVDLNDGLLVPPEVPVLTLDDIRKEARRRGITGLQGLDDDDDEEEQEERGGKGKEDDLKGIIIGGDMKEVPGEEEEDDEDEDEEGADAEAGEEGTEPDMEPPVVRQTLIFSATLSLEEEMRGGKKAKKPKHKAGKGDGNIVAKIMKQVGLRGRPAIIDLSTQAADSGAKPKGAGAEAEAAAAAPASAASAGRGALALPEGLQLTYVKTVGGEKDSHLYYFLRQYPGRTLVFTNSIDQAKRVARLLQILRLPARPLHAKMQQRQRLKSLDTFKSKADAILVATDVAARGLDIPLVEHVIHYDLPRSLEVFVHRAGRTARAQREGLSFSLVGPRDEKMHQDVGKVLLQGSLTAMPAFPVDLQHLSGARDRVNLAGRIVGYEQEVEKKKASQGWFLKSARDAELELDEELTREEEEGSHKDKQRAAQVAQDRQRLQELLDKPLVIERRKFVHDVAERLRQAKEQEKEEREEREHAAQGGGGSSSGQVKKKAAKALLANKKASGGK